MVPDEDATSFSAGLLEANSATLSSLIPAGDLITVGGGPPTLFSSIVLE